MPFWSVLLVVFDLRPKLMNRFKNLQIWKRSVLLATEIYRITSLFPEEEKYGLVSQLRRCAISISSNIAEGAGRQSQKEFKHFLSIAYGSLYELETQITISNYLDLLDEETCRQVSIEIDELQKMVFIFSKNLCN